MSCGERGKAEANFDVVVANNANCYKISYRNARELNLNSEDARSYLARWLYARHSSSLLLIIVFP
jgi:hypothetical protein